MIGVSCTQKSSQKAELTQRAEAFPMDDQESGEMTQKNGGISTKGEASSVSEHQTITVPLVKKTSFNKKGRPLGHSFFLRLSRGDLFIKLCESKVSAQQLEELTKEESDSKDSLQIQTVNVEVSFHEGEWDRCPDSSPFSQSRVGEYVVIHRLDK